MSRRLLNINDLGVSSPIIPVENPMELLKPKPVQAHTFVPATPIFLTAEEWNAICDKTHDATLPFKVEVTVVEKKADQYEDEGVEDDGNAYMPRGSEVKGEEPYVPKRVRKSKK